MSETEHHIGKLKPTGKRVNEYIGYLKIPSYYKSVDEYFRDEFESIACVIDGLVFEIEASNYEDPDDIFIASKNEDGSIDFQVKYHNGSCGFGEALGYAIKNIDNKDKQ